MTQSEADTILRAWGAHQRAEIDAEVGLPGVCASCIEYEAPDWVSPPAPVVSIADIERACWAMIVISARHTRLHRDLREHYRDGRKLAWQRLDQGRIAFARAWHEWDRVRGPVNAI